MSPYCPSCLGVAGSSEVRCPLDQQFLRRRNCGACGAELFPREQFCAECGQPNRNPVEVLLLPPEASARRQFGSLFLDYLGTGVLVFILVTPWFPILSLVLFPLFGIFYRTLGRAWGNQTFGQAVFSTTTVTPEAGPVGPEKALSRALWELLKSPLLALGKAGVERDLEERSSSLEIHLA
ncbi:MAG: hypothetical protein WC314_21095 [Vulcanimicrobiota bacterium]